MQTFLPSSNFVTSAKCLDRQRLGKQRIETKQILSTLLGYSDGWKNHPAVRMWDGYEVALAEYGAVICEEWRSRGYTDWIAFTIRQLRPAGEVINPPWLGDEKFHASHRSNLLRKDPIHYGRFGWTEPPTLPYRWPKP